MKQYKGMMIKNKRLLGLILLSALLSISCTRDKLSEVSAVEQNKVLRSHTDLDQWIKETLTLPYGIEVVYHWDRNAAEVGSYTYPPKEDKVREVLETAKRLWIDLYSQDTFGGSKYLFGKAPIKLYLYGGKNIDFYGFEHLANRAATGTEMHLYNVNDFDAKDETKVYALMRSVHHQFAHRLSELFPYDRDVFLSISSHRYHYSTADYLAKVQKTIKNRNDIWKISKYANRYGCITLNALLSAPDDFAEMVSVSLLHTPRELKQALKNANTPLFGYDKEEEQKVMEEAKQAHKELAEKLEFVRNYYSKNLGVNLVQMQRSAHKLMKLYTSKEEKEKES